MNICFFKFATLFYLLGTLAYLSYIFFLKEVLSKSAMIVTLIGFAVHTLTLVTRYLEAGYTPVTNLHESFSFFAWMIVGVFLAFHFRYKIKVLGAFVIPIALILMIFAYTLPQNILPLAPVLRSFWHPIHVVFSFLGYAFFVLNFCCGVMYLLQEHQLKSKKKGALTKRLLSLNLLDALSYQSLKFGFALLTLGIMTGAIWANNAWGRYWDWDVKETWALITWLLYAALLHQRLTVGWRGRKAAMMAIVGFLAILFTFLGVNFLPSLHSYAGWK